MRLNLSWWCCWYTFKLCGEWLREIERGRKVGVLVHEYIPTKTVCLHWLTACLPYKTMLCCGDGELVGDVVLYGCACSVALQFIFMFLFSLGSSSSCHTLTICSSLSDMKLFIIFHIKFAFNIFFSFPIHRNRYSLYVCSQNNVVGVTFYNPNVVKSESEERELWKLDLKSKMNSRKSLCDGYMS